jgi:hypothetical protein
LSSELQNEGICCTAVDDKLLKERTEPARPFINVGVGFSGTFMIKPVIPHIKVRTKGDLSLSVCLATKGINLELVSGLITAAFLPAFRRFIGSCVLCRNMSIDRYKLYWRQNKLHELESYLPLRNMIQEGITWYSITPDSPHFGDLWEAIISSKKHHLFWSVGNIPLKNLLHFSVILKAVPDPW